MRFDASLQRLQKAVQELEKASKNRKKRGNELAGQIDLFAAPVAAASNGNVDVSSLKNQLDEAISSVKTLLKESA